MHYSCHSRYAQILLAIIAFVAILSLSGPSFENVKDKLHSSWNPDASAEILVLISTPKHAIHHRAALRKTLFGLEDTIYPCLQTSGKVTYRFVVNGAEQVDSDLERRYQMDRLEWDDIVETNAPWQPLEQLTSAGYNEVAGLYRASLDWFHTQKDLTMNHVILANIYSVPNIRQIQKHLDTFTAIGSSDDSFDDEGIHVLTVGQDMKAAKSMPSGFMQYQNDPDMQGVDDPRSLLGVHGIHLPQDLDRVAHVMGIQPIKMCSPYVHPVRSGSKSDPFRSPAMTNPQNLNPASIAILTSSYIYPDNCMLHAAYPAMQNKRQYANRHGYTFVSRSEEYTYQKAQIGRKVVWGKIDVLQKVLPHFEWVLWMDVDALIVDRNLDLAELINRIGTMVDAGKWRTTSLIVSRPVGDEMLNAGVFLIRNTPWALTLLETVQANHGSWARNGWEQKALALAIAQPEFARNTVYLSPNDRLFGTLSSHYKDGDAMIHFAEAQCPADLVVKTVEELARRQRPSSRPSKTVDANPRLDQQAEIAAGAIPGPGFDR